MSMVLLAESGRSRAWPLKTRAASVQMKYHEGQIDNFQLRKEGVNLFIEIA